MKKSVILVTLIMGVCAFFAYMQDTQRKIEQETGKGRYCPNAVYRVARPPTKGDEADWKDYKQLAVVLGNSIDIPSIKTDKVVKY